jgi:hypothetical protein
LDDTNLYQYARSDPMNLVDSTGRAPYQGGVTTWGQVYAELHADSDLFAFSEAHKGVTNRYVFSDKYGWIDLRHFGQAAGLTAAGVPAIVTEGLGFVNEVKQKITESGNDYRSGFSPEDIPSNSAGADFGAYLKTTDRSIADALSAWTESVGARNPSDPNAGVGNLPETDPSGTPGGPSNTSSKPAGGQKQSTGGSQSSTNWIISADFITGPRSCGTRIPIEGC